MFWIIVKNIGIIGVFSISVVVIFYNMELFSDICENMLVLDVNIRGRIFSMNDNVVM